MINRTINNKIEFEEFMIEIDAILNEKDIPIQARTIQSLSEAVTLLNIENTKIFPIQSEPIDGLYEGDSLLAHIVKWIEDRYGDRLKVDFSLGHSLVLIRGNPWLIRFPYIIGRIRIICERDLGKKFQSFPIPKLDKQKQKPEINLLLQIDELPQGLANELTDLELKELLNHFVKYNQFSRLHSVLLLHPMLNHPIYYT